MSATTDTNATPDVDGRTYRRWLDPANFWSTEFPEPKTVKEATLRLKSVRAEQKEINLQIAWEKERQKEEQREGLNAEDPERSDWRRRLRGAALSRARRASRLQAWIAAHTTEGDQEAQDRRWRAWRDLRVARALLHRVLEEAILSEALRWDIEQTLQSGGDVPTEDREGARG